MPVTFQSGTAKAYEISIYALTCGKKCARFIESARIGDVKSHVLEANTPQTTHVTFQSGTANQKTAPVTNQTGTP